MQREGIEEAGVTLDWKPTVLLRCADTYAIHFFVGTVEAGMHEPATRTSEVIEAWQTREVCMLTDVIPNLKWIIPLSLDMHSVPGVGLMFPVIVEERIVDASAHAMAIR